MDYPSCRGWFGFHVKHCGGPLMWLMESCSLKGLDGGLWNHGGWEPPRKAVLQENLGESRSFGGPALNSFP